MINEPALQTNNLCPKCNEETAPYGGVIEVAPLWQQFSDERDGVSREWSSERHYCFECEIIFDRVITNKVTADGK